jgi:NifU-like protein involved in Fe-S cluster formation
MGAADPVLARFLRPAFALAADSLADWPASGVAETPGADARCRIVLAEQAGGRLAAAFAAFGPPEVIACADWLCERVAGQTVSAAHAVTVPEVETALALPPVQRYAGAIAVDALHHALTTLES